MGRPHTFAPFPRWLLLIVALSLFCGWNAECRAQSSSLPGAGAELEGKISTDNARVQAGESVRLRFELSNHGEEPFYISLRDSGLDPFSTLVLTIFRDGKRLTTDLGGFADYSPCFDIKSEQFITNRPLNAAKFSESWMELLPGQFYGHEVVIGPARFPELKTPGKYTVKGTYEATGFGYLINPYKAFEGKLESNSIEIEVLEPEKKGQ